jgi:hypothetical protein
MNSKLVRLLIVSVSDAVSLLDREKLLDVERRVKALVLVKN